MTVDVGTGDGRAILDAARDPRTLAIGLDASASAMADASRRAARSARRGGLPNAAFILAAAEAPPAELCGVASLVTVRFPWGSLLRGCLGRDEAVARGVATLLARNGTLELLLAPAARDGLEGLPTAPGATVAAAAGAFEPHGLVLVEGRQATTAEVLASGSSWARRLGAGRRGAASERAVTFVRFARPVRR